jgi:hypothetical protein
MAIRNVKRWQWILIGVLLGVALGYVNQLPSTDWKQTYGEALTQHQFEQGLTKLQSETPWFHGLVVHPERVEAGGKIVPIYVVAGEYYDGRQELQDGKRVAVWRPRCFVAETPFVPVTPPADPLAEETVLAYLKAVPGVSFRYAWWQDPKWGVSLWVGGCTLVVGLIWPTVINLLVFGSLTRPREAKADLSKSADVEVPAVSPSFGGVGGSDADAAAGVPDAPPPAAVPPAVQPLPNAPTDAMPAAHDQASTEFGRDEDDFYPTERHAPRH